MPHRSSLISDILTLSDRVSTWALPFKPFIRFMAPADMADRYWDFDYLLQKRLLACLYTVASAEEIAQSGIDQWRYVLQTLTRSANRWLQDARRKGIHEYHPGRTAHLAHLSGHMVPGARVLYVGAGTGPSCLWLASQGLEVLGIDPLTPLLQIARGWADYLALPAWFVAMDGRALGLRAHTFDGFMSIYGFLPTPSQTAALQRSLARVLRPEGIGRITAVRRKHATHMSLINLSYLPTLVHWLAPQIALDFYRSAPDAYDDILVHGLFQRTHSVDSLTTELSLTFDVVECEYDSDDSHYVSALVRSKPGVEMPERPSEPDTLPADPALTLDRITTLLPQVDGVCSRLEAHSQAVLTHFKTGGASAGKSCFQAIQPDFVGMSAALDAVFAE
jgi:ubiquinone/menaquinone biosynthesis C-methylase UbiE